MGYGDLPTQGRSGVRVSRVRGVGGRGSRESRVFGGVNEG